MLFDEPTSALDPEMIKEVLEAAHVEDPFTVVSVGPRKLMLGGVTGDQTDAVRSVVDTFTDAGVAGIVADDVGRK